MTTTGPNVLFDRSVGWLRYLHRKANTPDDWTRNGPGPHPHWDNHTGPPMLSWHRFDLVDSSYALGLMAQATPVWREPYVQILDQLIERHTGWFSAGDWLTQFGPDPDRANYPDAYRRIIPEHLWGVYDVPGWTVLSALALGLFEVQTRLAALVLFVVLLVGQMFVLRKRRAARCGCFGRTESLGFGSIGRGGVCLALAFASLVPLS